ncbi:MAG: sugar transferase [Oligoflexia bacterium]|nr:sugar transferase [Oligoflexia bacterium]
MYRTVVKVILDFLVAFVALILLFPLLLIIAAALWVFQDRQVVFRQIRPGLQAKPFTLFKFQTMRDTRDANGELLPDEQRLTQIGRALRASSLDELPQLLNVLRGEMSLIGPRPLLPEYVPLYNSFQRRRMEVRPGITGLAQVRGRNLLTWEQRFKADVEYVERCSFSLDLEILFRTVASVVKRSGISPADSVIMQRFTGSDGQC